MSEFEEQYDGNNVICPYCEESYQPEAEDYSEDERTETCGSCGMKFTLRQNFSVDHVTDPDCKLNGLEHKWESHKLGNDRFGEARHHDFCSVCGECRPFKVKL